MIPEGGCDCSDEAVLVSPDKDALSVRMAAHSALVNELGLAPSPRCIRVAICFFYTLFFLNSGLGITLRVFFDHLVYRVTKQLVQNLPLTLI